MASDYTGRNKGDKKNEQKIGTVYLPEAKGISQNIKILRPMENILPSKTKQERLWPKLTASRTLAFVSVNVNLKQVAQVSRNVEKT